MNWGLGQGTQMKMNYEAKSVSWALFNFSLCTRSFFPLLLFGIGAILDADASAQWVPYTVHSTYVRIRQRLSVCKLHC